MPYSCQTEDNLSYCEVHQVTLQCICPALHLMKMNLPAPMQLVAAQRLIQSEGQHTHRTAEPGLTVLGYTMPQPADTSPLTPQNFWQRLEKYRRPCLHFSSRTLRDLTYAVLELRKVADLCDACRADMSSGDDHEIVSTCLLLVQSPLAFLLMHNHRHNSLRSWSHRKGGQLCCACEVQFPC